MKLSNQSMRTSALACSMGSSLSRSRAREGPLLMAVVGPILLAGLASIQPAGAFLNCLTPPNMFGPKFGAGKMGFGGQSVAIPGLHPGERANWYPQAYTYASNPMSRLFKPKWMGGGGGGGSLFGPKRWLDWRSMGAANMNFYRPSSHYLPAINQVAPPPSAYLGGTNYNQFSEQLNLVPPYSAQAPLAPSYSSALLPSTSGLPFGSLQMPPAGSNYNNAAGQYASGGNSYNNNSNSNEGFGWSYPTASPYQAGQQNQAPSYNSDSLSVSPNSGYQTPLKQQADPYGIKGGSGSGPGKQQQYGATKKVLIADGV